MQDPSPRAVAANVDPSPAAHVCYYSTWSPAGSDVRGCIDAALMQCLLPGRWLLETAVDLLFHMAASRLRHRTGSDVRVVQSWIFQRWLLWATRASDGEGSHELPPHLQQSDFGKADFMLIPWYGGQHYSTLILTNPGAYCFHVLVVHCWWILLPLCQP